MVRGPGDLVFSPWTNSFGVSVTTIIGGSISHTNQTQAAVGGFFTYIPQSGAVFKSVKGDLLAEYNSSRQGLHFVYLAFYDATTNALIDQTVPEAFFVNTMPPKADIEITSGAGNCRKFNVGEPMIGHLLDDGDFARVLTLSVTPTPEANGGDLTITTLAPAALLVPPFGGAVPRSRSATARATLNNDRCVGRLDAGHERDGPLRLQYPHPSLGPDDRR